MAKSMAISESTGVRGMKLASVDRAEQAREDRDAAALVSSWRSDVGRLRSAVAAANAAAGVSKDQALFVPEIAEVMLVQTAKGVPTSLKACIVCGLKREERVVRVDGAVEDCFGEWWVEHWGHVACRNFWKGNEEQMRQR